MLEPSALPSVQLQPFSPKVEFSVVIGCYFEEQSVDEFHRRLSQTLQSMGRSYEILYVNDGSTDGTFEKLKAIYEQDQHVTAVVDFFKNAGQPNAKTPGVMLAQGSAIVMIDSDLQLDPEELPRLVKEYDAGHDLVSGYRHNRRDPWLRKLPSKIANAIMRHSSHSKMRDFGCTFKIYDARLVRAFEFGPFHPWRPVPVIAMARDIAEVPVTHHPRKYGSSGWTFRKLFAYNMEGLVNLSERPFQALSAICFLLGVLFIARVAIGFLTPFSILPQITNGLLLNAWAIGLLMTLAVLALIGEFVIRSFLTLQRKPAFAIREIQRRDPPA